jgi:hypothetical protein
VDGVVKLVASDASADDRFGSSVALDGDTAVIGAYRDNHVGGFDAGSAYVFVRTGEAWTEQSELTAWDAASDDNFGSSVALDCDTAVIGADIDDNASAPGAGAAYVFVLSEYAPPQCTLTVSVEGQGVVELDPPGGTYECGTNVELWADAAEGWYFDRWEGALSGATNPETLIVDEDKSVTAVFEQDAPPPQCTLTVTMEGQGGVELDPPDGSYECGTSVTLTATPDADWQFVRWERDLTGSDNPADLNVDDDLSVTAVFQSSESEDTVPATLVPPVGPCGLTSVGLLTVAVVGLLRIAHAHRRTARRSIHAGSRLPWWGATPAGRFAETRGVGCRKHICLAGSLR